LTQYDLFKLIERQFIHAETYKVGKNGKKSTIVFAISSTCVQFENEVVGDLDEVAISFTAIENLSHEDSLGVLALEGCKKLFCV